MYEHRPFEHNNSREYLRTLISRAYLSFGAPLVLFGWLYLESTAGRLSPRIPPELIRAVSFTTLGLMILFVIAGYRQSSRVLKLARTQETLFGKLLLYRKALTTKFVYFAIAALIIAIGLYLTANELISILFAGIIVIFSISNPTLQGIVRDLQLKGEDREMILTVKDFK